MARTEKTLALVSNLGTSATTIYTVPSSTKTVVTAVHIANKATAVRKITIAIKRSGTSYYFFYETSISARGVLDWTGHLAASNAGDIIEAYADNTNSLDVIVSGWENA